MKKLVMMMLAAVFAAGICTAAPKAEKNLVTTVFTTDVDCPHCAKKITDTIPYEKGVKDVQVDVPTKTVTVTYDADKTGKESLLKAFAAIKVKVFAAENKK